MKKFLAVLFSVLFLVACSSENGSEKAYSSNSGVNDHNNQSQERLIHFTGNVDNETLEVVGDEYNYMDMSGVVLEPNVSQVLGVYNGTVIDNRKVDSNGNFTYDNRGNDTPDDITLVIDDRYDIGDTISDLDEVYYHITIHTIPNPEASDEAKPKNNDKSNSASKPTISETPRKINKEDYNTGLTYEDLARTPDKHEGKLVTFSGKVLQVQEIDQFTTIRLAVDDNYDTVIFLILLTDMISDSRILEDDYITVYGVSSGLYSYEAVMGQTITLPAVVVDSIDR
ncbi:hypothetical protein [Aerococcus loyolae]|uniref:TcdA-E operon negative regulator n=1 Tax=Aerococcus loyolae TaxID=2976809 RepID=A0ABT4BXP0_9LACT|nr:hypothetical protein [Aerococcus loyolae]MCY3024925.1 hypothetical protein [Aerococcus loyolae]MCY3027019.1 hypothetical protein [Aerococcus loyolae]MCY3028603.1 hypothetical protein [Aerococcus loyolae]OAM70556.1 hypothetical protein A1D21_02830 [Aerococcus loyolae]